MPNDALLSVEHFFPGPTRDLPTTPNKDPKKDNKGGTWQFLQVSTRRTSLITRRSSRIRRGTFLVGCGWWSSRYFSPNFSAMRSIRRLRVCMTQRMACAHLDPARSPDPIPYAAPYVAPQNQRIRCSAARELDGIRMWYSYLEVEFIWSVQSGGVDGPVPFPSRRSWHRLHMTNHR